MSLFSAGPAFAQLDLGGSLSGEQSAGLVDTVVDTVSEVASPVLDPQETSDTQDAVSSTVDPVGATAEAVTSTTAPILEQATPALQEATTSVQATAQPVLATAAPLVQAAAQPVLATAAPLLNAAEPIVTAVTQPILEAAAPVLAIAQPLLDTTAPLLDATEPLVAATSSITDVVAPLRSAVEPLPLARDTQQSAPTSAVSSTPATRPDQGSPAEPVDGGSSVVVPPARPTSEARAVRRPGSGPGQKAAVVTIWPPPVDWNAPVTPGHASGTTTAAASPRRPAPGLPGNPLGLLSSVSAGSPSGASLLVFAAFVAALLLAAPGLGRRLRPYLAPWPPPIALPSLERPG